MQQTGSGCSASTPLDSRASKWVRISAVPGEQDALPERLTRPDLDLEREEALDLLGRLGRPQSIAACCVQRLIVHTGANGGGLAASAASVRGHIAAERRFSSATVISERRVLTWRQTPSPRDRVVP